MKRVSVVFDTQRKEFQALKVVKLPYQKPSTFAHSLARRRFVADASSSSSSRGRRSGASARRRRSSPTTSRLPTTLPVPSTTIPASTSILRGRGQPDSSIMGIPHLPELPSFRAWTTALEMALACSAGVAVRHTMLLLRDMLTAVLIRRQMGELSSETSS